MQVPKSATKYSAFLTGTVLTAEGVEVRTGPLTMDTVHPDLKKAASDAQAFYAHTGSAVADVAIGEDKYGIWIHGAMRPGVTAEQVRALRASDISPDWRTVNGKPRELCALLAVNNSGFKMPALVASAGGEDFVMPGRNTARIEDGELVALVAVSGISGENMLESAMDRIDQLESMVARLTAHAKPDMQAKARERALALVSAKERHPAGEPKKDDFASTRQKLAKARALRLVQK